MDRLLVMSAILEAIRYGRPEFRSINVMEKLVKEYRELEKEGIDEAKRQDEENRINAGLPLPQVRLNYNQNPDF